MHKSSLNTPDIRIKDVKHTHIHSFLIISNDDNSLISGVLYAQKSRYLVEKLPKYLNQVLTPPMLNIQQHDSKEVNYGMILLIFGV